MKSFFKQVLATIVGIFITGFIFFFLGFLLLIGIASSVKHTMSEIQDGGTTKIKSNAVVQVKLNYPIYERTSDNPWDHIDFSNFEARNNLGLNQIIKHINKAKEDQDVKGLYLDLNYLEAGLATIEEIRNVLLDFKESGKFIVAYAEIYTQKAYYLASVADHIFINPTGMMEFKGFASESVYLKRTLEKLEIEPEIFVSGKYKSAVEIFKLEKMSAPAREQITVILEDLYKDFLNKIGTSRNIKASLLDSIADNFLIRKPKDAVHYHLADAAYFEDQVDSIIGELLGLESNADINFISLKKYVKVPTPYQKGIKDKIAVIYAEGNIVSGKSDDRQIASEDMTKAIREAREDDKIKAVVLRVNSPGGSALASDVIWRELLLTKEKKPVVVSMGDVAASGGYYISCMADKIVAQPNTITGSIGVFGLMLNGENFYKNKLGFTFDRVKTGKHSDIGYSFLLTRPLTGEEKMIIQNEVEDIYDIFLERVASGRGINKEQVHAMAQGRVWSGVKAKEIGLVDELGNINDAVKIAAELAELEHYKIEELPKHKDPFAKIMESFNADVKSYFLENEMGIDYKYYKQVKNLLHQTGIQARMPLDIRIN